MPKEEEDILLICILTDHHTLLKSLLSSSLLYVSRRYSFPPVTIFIFTQFYVIFLYQKVVFFSLLLDLINSAMFELKPVFNLELRL